MCKKRFIAFEGFHPQLPRNNKIITNPLEKCVFRVHANLEFKCLL